MANGVILVVDDNPTNLKLTKLILKSQGYEVHTATGGRQLIRTLEVLRPDLILMDVQLPDTDGLELTRQIKNDSSTANVSIVALTANVKAGEEQRAIDAGCDGYIAKPIDAATFPDLIQKYIADRKVNFHATENRFQSVLIAEDDALRRKMLENFLKKEGYQVTATSDGAAALEQALRLVPHVVVSDILMPRLDGFRLCQAIRTSQALVNTHVVLTTSASIQPSDDRLAREMGATAFVPKSENFAEILTSIRHASKLQPPRVKRIGAEDLEPLKRSFLEEGRNQLKALVGSDTGPVDLDTAARMAHRWSGTGGTLGFPEISQLAFDLQRILSSLDGPGQPDGDENVAARRILGQLDGRFKESEEAFNKESTIPQSVRQAMKSKRIALVGMSGPDAQAIRTSISGAGGSVEVMERAPESDSRFDLLIVEAGSQLAGPVSTAPMPILIVGPSDRLDSFERGSDRDFMVTPVEEVELLLRCTNLMVTTGSSEASPTVNEASNRPRILIIDDDPSIIGLLDEAFAKIDIESHHAMSGDVGLKLARELEPQAIVLDVNMPNLNGFDVLEQLRADLKTKSIPVVLLTSRKHETDVLRGFQLGADDYVTKPFNANELIARLQRLLLR